MLKILIIVFVGLFFALYDGYNPITTTISIVGAIVVYQLDKIIKLLNEFKKDTSK